MLSEHVVGKGCRFVWGFLGESMIGKDAENKLKILPLETGDKRNKKPRPMFYCIMPTKMQEIMTTQVSNV